MKMTKKIVFLMIGLSLIPWDGITAEISKAKKIRGGKNYEMAAPLEVNRDYRLNHNQKPGEFDYFQVQLPPYSVISLELQTFRKGTMTGLQLEDNQKKQLMRLEVSGTPEAHRRETIRNRSATPQNHFLLVGSAQGPTRSNQAVFKISMMPFHSGDLGTNQDAGEQPSAGMPIMTGKKYEDNSLGGEDQKDFYTFSANKGEWYTVALKAEEPASTSVRVKVMTPDQKKKLASYVSGSSDQVMTHSFKIPRSGEYLVDVNLMNSVPDKNFYSLQLSRVVGKNRGEDL